MSCLLFDLPRSQSDGEASWPFTSRSGADGQLDHALRVQQVRGADLGSLDDGGLVQDVAVNLNKGVALHEDGQRVGLHNVQASTGHEAVGNNDLTAVCHTDSTAHSHVSSDLGSGNPVGSDQLGVELRSRQQDLLLVVIFTVFRKSLGNIGGDKTGGSAGVVLFGSAVRSQSGEEFRVNFISNGSNELSRTFANGVAVAGQDRFVGDLDRLAFCSSFSF